MLKILSLAMERFVKNDSFNCGRVEEKKKLNHYAVLTSNLFVTSTNLQITRDLFVRMDSKGF